MGLSILQWNAHGLKAHYAFFHKYIFSLENLPDIICIQETFLKPNKTFSLAGYSVIRRDRTSAPCGGVVTLVHKSISYDELICPGNFEAIGVQINSSEGLIDIYNVHIPPDSPQDISLLDKLFTDRSVVCGDFNAHHILWGSSKTDDRGAALERVLMESNHTILNDGHGTYIINNEKTSPLDLTFVHKQFALNADWVVENDELGSDHFPVLTTINFSPIKETPAQKSLNTRRANWEFYKLHAAVYFTDINFDESIENVHQNVLNAITSSIEKATPDESIRTRKPPKVPYWDKTCEDAHMSKVKSKRRAARTKLLSDHIKYKHNKAICQRVIRKRQTQYWRNFCTNLNRTSNLSKVWKIAKGMSGGLNSKQIPILKSGESKSFTNIEKANTLAKQFSQVSSSQNYSANFRDHKNRFEIDNKEKLNYKPKNNKVLNANFTINELIKAIKKSKNTAPGEDKLPYCVYKQLPKGCLLAILRLFNLIWKHGTLPSSWTHSIIVPFPKPGKDPHLPSSYRPIALTSTMCKLMERLLVNRLTWYCEKYTIFNKFQAGFRKNRSTMDHILYLHQDINNSLCTKGKALSVFLDIEKTYDMVWKEGLLFKLDGMGIDIQMFNWIKNFLSNRTLKVRVGDSFSDTFVVENGTPQGSVVSPILFIIMINDITVFKDPNIRFSLYADDLAIWKCGNMGNLAKSIQNALDEITTWCSKWGFKMSVVKSVVVPFSRSSERISISLNNNFLAVKTEFKFLGVVFDSSLSWRKHIEYIYNKCLKCVSGSSWGASKEILVILYKTLIRSVLDYGAIVYDSASPSSLEKLDKIQNTCLRLACGASKFTQIAALEVDCGVEPLFLRRQSLQIKQVSRMIYSSYPINFQEKGWQYYYGLFKGNNKHILDKIGPFFDKLDGICMPKVKLSPVPPWELPYITVNTSLVDVGKKSEHAVPLKTVATEILQRYSEHTQIFTDGSSMNGAAASAFFVQNSSITKSFKLKTSSIHKAELFAILQALVWLESYPYPKALLISDSLSSVISIEEHNSAANPCMVSEIWLSLYRNHSSGKTVELLWVPSHNGIQGNETVDKVARNALKNAVEIDLAYEMSDIYRLTNEYILNTWQSQWTSSNVFYKYICPDVSFRVKYKDSNRHKEVQLTRLRFDKTRLIGHLYKYGIILSGECSLCGEFEDPQHVFMDCVYYQGQQHKLISQMYDLDLSINYRSLISSCVMYNHLYRFISDTNLIL